MKIWNPAVLPEGWDLAKLLGEHASHPFNPDIANVFFRAGEIETWGRGIHRILEACEAAEVPKPELRYTPNDLWLEFPFSKLYLKALGEATERAQLDRSEKKLGDRLGDRLGDNRRRIIEEMRANPSVSAAQLSQILEISKTAVENNIAYLKEKGYIRRIGQAKGGHWELLE